MQSSSATASIVARADAALRAGQRQQAATLLEEAVGQSHDSAILLRLAVVRRALGEIEAALSVTEAAIKADQTNFLALLMRADLLQATDALDLAGRTYRAALRYAPPDSALSPPIRHQLDRARERAAADQDWQQSVVRWGERPEARLDDHARARVDGFRTSVLENFARGPLDPSRFIIPGLPHREYFEKDEFAGIEDLLAETDSIRREFLDLIDAKAGAFGNVYQHADQTDLNADVRRWSMIPLIRSGRTVDEFADHCPRTMALVRRLASPAIALIAPSVWFSVLKAGGHIAPHTGITNAHVILHIPLIVPSDCAFRVGGETRQWEIGTPLIFDDTIEHEAWNKSQEDRVVLIADLWRPELAPAERMAVTDLMNRQLIRAA
ncbi:aspartyl/asparaginyl beta-hydroxylase domain-containing protein [uncultured Sphingomonas sp.]|uniref:aspartyl/asparaginyl beta-hydroxylase domain-containing protein n=1 Tax=uncultured Sphingomonas sp. TaxID=158754 RepID=UPI0035CA7766